MAVAELGLADATQTCLEAEMVQKKDIDWGSLGFAYMHTDYSYVSNYKDGAWDEGGLTPDHTVTLSECAGLLHYCQEVF